MRENKIAYAIKHKDEDIRAKSRSGGVFTALSDKALDKGGVIYGCALDESFLAVHKRADSKPARDAFRGSKYIQSRMEGCFAEAEADLKSGRTVLFSGTPCQIDGLNFYLKEKNIDTEKLLTIDILCHGVPSPAVWKRYIDWKSGSSKIVNVDFRDKGRFGWADHKETLYYEDSVWSGEEFKTLFYAHYLLRPSCFECHYKSTNRISDITIGDYWHINELDASFNDDKGVSLVLANTEKGKAALKECCEDLLIKEFPLINSMQKALEENYPRPKDYEQFWADYKVMELGELIEKHTAPPKKTKKTIIVNFILNGIRRVLKLVKKK